MKIITLITAATLGLVSATAAFAEGKNPAQAISKNVDKNGAFSSIPGGVTNGNLNFGNSGAMRSFNGNGSANAAPNSAVDTSSGVVGTRVEPTGHVSGQSD